MLYLLASETRLTCLESRSTIPLSFSKSAHVEEYFFRCGFTQPPGFIGRGHMKILQTLWSNQEGQDIAEYAVMLAVILLLVIGTIRLVGSNANNAFSSAASSIQ
jgi:Flp pilus assembly pilin Flp